ncbi:MAG: AF1514 family protein, partial [Sulfuricella sp.]
MKEVHINYSGVDLDYKMASGLATSFAEKEPYITEPVMVAWHDKKASRMSPVIA